MSGPPALSKQAGLSPEETPSTPAWPLPPPALAEDGPHLGRKRPSARAQIRKVVASSSAEMAPAAFTCSATS